MDDFIYIYDNYFMSYVFFYFIPLISFNLYAQMERDFSRLESLVLF